MPKSEHCSENSLLKSTTHEICYKIKRKSNCHIKIFPMKNYTNLNAFQILSLFATLFRKQRIRKPFPTHFEDKVSQYSNDSIALNDRKLPLSIHAKVKT